MGIFKVCFEYNLHVNIVDVYAVENGNNGCPQFLIYSAGEWCWVDAKGYKPYKE